MGKTPAGIVRNIDALGRIVIPKETLMRLNIANGDPLEFFIKDDGSIALKLYKRGCVFCDETEELNEYKGKLICNNCLNTVKRARPVYTY